jgi:hypothetical protein
LSRLIVERHAEIEDPPQRHIGLVEEENSRRNGSRGAERPTWPRIAAELLVVAWKLLHGELLHFSLPLSPTNSHISTSPSPLATMEGQGKRKRGVRETKPSIASYSDLEIWRPPFELIQQGCGRSPSCLGSNLRSSTTRSGSIASQETSLRCIHGINCLGITLHLGKHY